MASMHWALSNKVIRFLMGMRIILNTRSHANNNTPTGIRSEDENWVVDGSELGVDSGVHLMPLMHFQSVVGDRGREHRSCVTM